MRPGQRNDAGALGDPMATIGIAIAGERQPIKSAGVGMPSDRCTVELWSRDACQLGG